MSNNDCVLRRTMTQGANQQWTFVLAGACSVLALASHAFGQTTTAPTLPQVTVETPKAAPKKQQQPAQGSGQAATKAPAPKRVARPQPQPQPQPTVAQEQVEPPVVTPENATTGAARDAALQSRVYSTPASVSTVGIGDAAMYGQPNMNDVLRTLPGTSVRDSANNPGIAVNIRGMEGAGRVNMMIDGVRQNFRFTGHEAQGFAYVDPSLLAGVDIARGAVSTAGGAGALAGAANFRTLDIIDVLKPGQTVGGLSSVSFGNNGQRWTGMQAGAMSSGNVGFVGAISGRNPDEFKNGSGQTVPFTGQDLVSGLVKGEFKLSPEHWLKLGGLFYDNDFVSNSYNQNVNSQILTLNYRYKPIDSQLIDFRFNTYRSDVKMVYLSPYVPSAFLTAGGRNITDLGTGFDFTNTSNFRLGPIKVKADYGYEYFHDDVTAINSTAVPNRGVNPSGESTIGGIFSQTTFSYGIADFITGLRYDHASLNGSGSITAANPLGMPAGNYTIDRDDSRLDPKLTFQLKPTKWFMPYVTYSETMRAPNVSESLTGGDHPATGGPSQSFYPNPFLVPEISKGWEFGFNTAVERVFTHKDKLNFKADYYTNDVKDYITACFGPMGQTYFCNNFGTSKVQGVEMQGMYDAGFFFMGGSYAWNDSNLPSQVNGFGGQSFQPEHVFSLSGGVRLLDERWTLGGRLYHASDAFIGLINATNPAFPYTQGYTLVDLYTSYKLTPDIDIGATVTNIADVSYTPATATPATGGFTGDTGRGRTVIFTARAKF